MTKWDVHSPEVSSPEENETEIKAAELFTNGVSLNEGRRKAIEEACKTAYSPFSRLNVLSLEDLVQEVIVKILTAKNPYQGDEKLPPFAWRIARNHLVDVYRESKRCMSAAQIKAKHDECRESEARSEAEVLDDIHFESRDINRNNEESRELRMIAAEEFHDQLTPFQQFVLQLLDQGYRQTEIADMCEVTPQAISRCRDRINKKLRIYLCIPEEKSFVKSP